MFHPYIYGLKKDNVDLVDENILPWYNGYNTYDEDFVCGTLKEVSTHFYMPGVARGMSSSH